MGELREIIDSASTLESAVLASGSISDELLIAEWEDLPNRFQALWKDHFGPPAWQLDELPRSLWDDAMFRWFADEPMVFVVSEYNTVSEFRLDLENVPAVATRDGFRLPERIVVGIFAELAGDNPWIDPAELGGDALRVTEFLHPLSARRLHCWALAHASDFGTNRAYEWESVFEAPELHLKHWQECEEHWPRIVQVLGQSCDRCAPLVAWRIREMSGDGFGRSVSAMPVANEPLASLKDWLEAYFPRDVPVALEPIAQAWLGACAERGTVWSIEDWRRFREIAWFGQVATKLVWVISNARGVEQLVRVEGDEFLNLNEEVTGTRTRRIRVAHRFDMTDEEFYAWSKLFSDYEMVQPFGQLTDDGVSRTSNDARALIGRRVDVFGFTDDWKPDFDSPAVVAGQSDGFRLDSERGSARIVVQSGSNVLLELEFIDAGGSSMRDADPVVVDRVVRDIELVVR